MGYNNIMIYLTSTTEVPITNANIQISSNCGLPNSSGTETWATPTQSVDNTIWFILKPPIEGWGNTVQFTQAEMMAGVDETNITEQEYNSAWFPVFVED